MTSVESIESGAVTSSLSGLDESGLLGQRYTLINADNATLSLRGPDGRVRQCSDFMSAYAAVNFGHRNPLIERALTKSSDLAALCYPAEAEQVARWLCEQCGPGVPRRVLYQVGGSFAVSTALALARRVRPGHVLAVDGAFHGLGVDTGAISTVQRDFALQDTGLPALVAGEVSHVRPGTVPRQWDGVSCLIYEPIQGANGYLPLETGWLQALTGAARAAGVVTIADEIQCGFFRHGTFSPSRSAGLDPDIVLYGKSLTNGMYPLSAVVYKGFLDEHAGPVYLAHTFQTGTLGPAAAHEVTRYIDDHDVPAMAAVVEKPLRELADDLIARGVAREVYVTGPALSFEPLVCGARDVVRSAFDRGVLVFSGGRTGQRVRVAPPLTTPPQQLADGVEVLRSVLAGCRDATCPGSGGDN